MDLSRLDVCATEAKPIWQRVAHNLLWFIVRIIFYLEIMEGKDAPKELAGLLAKRTTGLLLRLTKALHHTGKVVVLDSGFCVLSALVDKKVGGLFGGCNKEMVILAKARTWQGD